MKSLKRPHNHCPPSGKGDSGAIICHGFYRTRRRKRRRYRCQSCGKPFGSTSRTPYYRLQHRRATFDEAAALSVEGLNKSAIARAKRIAWNTVHRWLERAVAWCRRFNSRKIKILSGAQLQADGILAIVGAEGRSVWVFVVVDVWSRLWPSTIVGKRSYRNTLNLFRDLFHRMSLDVTPLITTDGFKFYERVIGRVFAPACVYGQVIKSRRNDRVVSVKRRAVIGAGRLQQALRDSEDSVKLNTSFVERLNLTVRQGSSYLGCRTICQARRTEPLEGHLELLRCYYNFVRPHRALKFGRQVRTQAQQAGLTNRRLTLREIFLSRMFSWLPKNVIFVFLVSARPVTFTPRRLALVV